MGPHPLKRQVRPGSRRPPEQTRITNLGPLVRSATGSRRSVAGGSCGSPPPGVYLWRTPHGYWFRVDNDGTHPLGRDPDLAAHDPPDARSSMEHALADLVASS